MHTCQPCHDFTLSGIHPVCFGALSLIYAQLSWKYQLTSRGCTCKHIDMLTMSRLSLKPLQPLSSALRSSGHLHCQCGTCWQPDRAALGVKTLHTFLESIFSTGSTGLGPVSDATACTSSGCSSASCKQHLGFGPYAHACICMAAAACLPASSQRISKSSLSWPPLG